MDALQSVSENDPQNGRWRDSYARAGEIRETRRVWVHVPLRLRKRLQKRDNGPGRPEYDLAFRGAERLLVSDPATSQQDLQTSCLFLIGSSF